MKSSRYDISLIRRYLNGELDAAAMYKLERQAQEDPMLMDLMLGMESGGETDHSKALADIDELISRRTDKQSPRIIAWRTVGIAASILIAVSIAVLYLLPDNPSQQISQKSLESPLPKKEILKPADPVKKPGSVLGERPLLSARLASKKQKAASVQIKGKKKFPENIIAVNKESDPPNIGLNQVEIVGYATQKKSDLTGAVEPITSTLIPSDSISHALAGRVAGVSTKAGVKPGNEIIIRGTNSSNTSDEIKSLVSGQVNDKQDNKPLPGVLVRVKGTNITATTDANGRFRIGLPDKNAELELIYIGYEKELISVNRRTNLDIALNPSMSALNEVIVVGYGSNSANPSESKPAKPAKGWTSFRKYLRDHAMVYKNKDEGVVVLSITVSPNGNISDVKIINGINEQINQKAIDLLLNGPKWTGDSDGLSKEIRLRIRFRYREK